MISPLKFASNLNHKRLYEAYDHHPEVWKPALAAYFDNRYWDFTQEEPATQWHKQWTEDQYLQASERAVERIKLAKIPFEMESCDYWCEKRMNNAIRYTKHASCQWMSKVNYYLACKFLSNYSWFHISDNDMQGASHFYVMNDQGEILDPQGLALDFPVGEYQKTFNDKKVTAHWDVMWDLSWWDDEFPFTDSVDYMNGSPSDFEKAYLTA